MMGDAEYPDDRDFDLAYVAIETNVEALRDRLVNALIHEKHLVDALVQRINVLAAKERTA